MKANPIIRPLVDALLGHFQSSDEGLNAVVDTAVLVAIADGKIDEAELAELAASIDALMGAALDPKLTRHLIRESRANIEEAGAEARAEAIGKSLAAHAATDDGLRLALAVAYASDGLSAEERARVETIARGAGVDAAAIDALAKTVQSGASA